MNYHQQREKNVTFKPLSSYGVGNNGDGADDARQRILNEATQESLDDDLKLYGLWKMQVPAC